MFGALMAAFMGVSPFVANVAGRWADATLSRAAQAEQATLRQVPATLLQAAPARRHGAKEIPDTPAQWHSPDGQLRKGRVSAPAGAEAGSRVKVWINQAGDVVALRCSRPRSPVASSWPRVWPQPASPPGSA